MTPNPTNTSTSAVPAGRRRSADLWLVAGCLAITTLAITTQSFWIDEACTATKAMQPTLSRWWGELVRQGGSDQQMPFYMLYAWVWEKVFGHSEWWLRASNLPWLALGLLAIPRRQITFLVVISLSPFVWFYMDEARPYIMQVGCGLLTLGAMWRLTQVPADSGEPARQETLWTNWFCLGLLLLAGSSLLGVIWDATAVGCAVVVLGGKRAVRLLHQHRIQFGVLIACLLALAPYYLWSLTNPIRAITGSTDVNNILFATYEFLGFSGLGPGRIEIRENPLAAVRPFAPRLALQACVTAYVLMVGFFQLIRGTPRRIWLGVVLCLAAGAGLLFAAGAIKHVRILARHAAPLAPVFLLLAAAGVSCLWRRGGLRRLVALGFILLSLASSVSLRLAPRHAKDDYRQAAAVARAAVAKNERVWWCASGDSGIYYGLAISFKPVPVPGQAWLAFNPPIELLTNQMAPDLIVLSKPDLFDGPRTVRDYIERGGYRVTQKLHAFEFRRKESP